jgi:hypothetical protein
MGIPLPQSPVTNKQSPLTERNRLIGTRYAAGETLQAIAQDLGLSHQRVHQIIQEQIRSVFFKSVTRMFESMSPGSKRRKRL